MITELKPESDSPTNDLVTALRTKSPEQLSYEEHEKRQYEVHQNFLKAVRELWKSGTPAWHLVKQIERIQMGEL